MRLLAIGWGSKESVNLATPTEYRNGHDDEYGDNLAFRVFEFDTQGVELRRSGVPIKLRDQSSRILVYLLEHAGQMVTREELRQYLWPSDTFVDFDHSLNTAVMKLREALGDSVDKPLYIETIPKRGYRFVAPVSSGLAETRNGSAGPTCLPLLISKRLLLALTESAPMRLRQKRSGNSSPRSGGGTLKGGFFPG